MPLCQAFSDIPWPLFIGWEQMNHNREHPNEMQYEAKRLHVINMDQNASLFSGLNLKCTLKLAGDKDHFNQEVYQSDTKKVTFAMCVALHPGNC